MGEGLLKIKHWALVVILACACPKQSSNIDDSLHIKFDDCEKAQFKLIELSCKDSKGKKIASFDKSGKRFSEFCKEKISQGYELNPGCIAMISDCKEIDSCR